MIKSKIVKSFFLSLPFFIAIIFTSLNTKIWADELWSYYCSYLNSVGNKPYIDYFTHRLALWEIINSKILTIFGNDIMNLRYFSVFIGSTTIFLLSFFILSYINNFIYALILLLLTWNILTFQAFSTATVYSLPCFFYILSILIIHLFYVRFKVFSLLIFFFLQGVILSMRYFLDPQLVLILLLIPVVKVYCKLSLKITLLLLFASFLPLLYTLKSVLSGNLNFWYDTVIYNMQQIEYAANNLNLNHNNNLAVRILLMRFLELKAFIPIILIFIYSFKSIFLKFISILKNTNLLSEVDFIFLYSFLFILGYYLFYFISAHDFPISKIYIVIPIIVILTLLYQNILLQRINNFKNELFILFILIFFPIFTDYSLYARSKNAQNYFYHYSKNVASIVKPNSFIFSFNLLLAQSNFILDKNAAMELYSKAHYFDNHKAFKLHLLSTDYIVNNLKNKSYDALVLDHNRSFYTSLNMTNVFSKNEKKIILNEITNNYKLTKVFLDLYGQKIYIYIKK